MKNLKPILASLMILFCFVSFAQEKIITGIVTENGLPLPGVTVSVKRTSRAVQTDFDGKYSIKASKGETLVFSYIGFKTTSAIVGEKNILNVELKTESTELAEVVNVGYARESEYKNHSKRTKSEKSEVMIRGYV